jgi:hypothetical protein
MPLPHVLRNLPDYFSVRNAILPLDLDDMIEIVDSERLEHSINLPFLKFMNTHCLRDNLSL